MANEEKNHQQEWQEKITEFGIDDFAVIAADLIPSQYERLQEWLAAGYHGEMSWMEQRVEQRSHPQGLWPDVQSVVIMGMNYAPAQNPLPNLEQKEKAVISAYASNLDYHDVFKKRIKQMASWLVKQYGGDVKVFVDTAPVMEKPIAAAAGLGWQGKHTNIVSRRFGSWLFLAAIYATKPLHDYIPPRRMGHHCGSCQRCLDICPTQAFIAPYKLDARRCISYLTIEYKGHIAKEFRKAIGNRVYGCDDCTAICPWNSFAAPTPHEVFQPREKQPYFIDLAFYAAMDDTQFREFFRKSPVKRIGRDRFVRNIMIAIGNSATITLMPSIVARLADDSPLVRAMAVWAFIQLWPLADGMKAAKSWLDVYKSRYHSEIDLEVMREYQENL